MSEFVLSCDWGTSNLRLSLVQTHPFNVLTRVSTKEGIAQVQGIAHIHRLWEEEFRGNGGDPRQRVPFYGKFLRQAVRKLEEESGFSLRDLPIVVSGMASSSIGLKELPYASLPFDLSCEDIVTEWLPRSLELPHNVLLVSGIKGSSDMMRGEETQLIGLATTDEAWASDAVFVLPGTHSKHVQVKNGSIFDFRTHLTGELLEAISNYTVLAASVLKTPRAEGGHVQAFRKGVQVAAKGDLLNDLFSVRVRELLGETTREENFHYLSGLLIGHELRSLSRENNSTIILSCGEDLLAAYKEAIACLGLAGRTRMLPPQLAEEAAARGQLKIFRSVTERRLASA